MSSVEAQNVAAATEDTNAATKSPPKRKRKQIKRRSSAWDHFTRYVDKDGHRKARCNYCPVEYCCDSKDNGITNLNRHVERCPNHPARVTAKQALLVSQFKAAGGNGEGEGTLGVWKFDQDVIRNGLSRMIIIDELPFKFVEKEGFKCFMSLACPKFKIPSRFTIARDCFQLYLEERKNLQQWLRTSGSRVCLTTDTWTSVQRVNYMCVTAHFVDSDWNLQKKILNFCPISSHKGSKIGEMIENCLLDWKIDKMLTITVDNASSNDTAISYVKKILVNRKTDILGGKYLHMRCIAHVINLVIIDGLKEASDSIAKVRAVVKYVRNSPSRLPKFKSCVEFEKIECKSLLCLDVCTRWNSTYLMLSTALNFVRAFARYELNDPNFLVELEPDPGVPTDIDWEIVKRLVTLLKSFYEMTLRISGSLYVTLNTFFHEISEVDCLLKEWEKDSDVSFSLMAKKMKEKYDKYWGDIEKMNMLIYVAVVLDPRHKLEYVQFVFSELHGKDSEIEKRMAKNVRDATFELFFEYRKMNQSQSGESSGSVQGMNEGAQEILPKHLKERYKKFKSLSGSGEGKSELEKYLGEDCEDDNASFDILTWWKFNSSRFPILSQMARDVLAVPISTVASESAFSTGGRVLDIFRSSLNPKMVQALLCAQDWIRSSPNILKIEEDLVELEKLDEELSQLRLNQTILDI